MATTLGSIAEGSVVKIKENGVLTDFYVAKHDYESGLNGTGRTLLVRKVCYDIRAYDSENNAYANSDIDAWLNSTYIALLNEYIQAAMGATKFYYTPGNGDYTTNAILERAVFILSYDELLSSKKGLPAAKILLSTLTNPNFQWTRTPVEDPDDHRYVYYVTASGMGAALCTNSSYAVRPTFTLPESLRVYDCDDGYVISYTPPSTPGSITVPTRINGGTAIEVSWDASTDAEGNLEGYIVERSTDGGSTWTQIYQGAATSTTNSVPFGVASVKYRVKAYDSDGLESGYCTGSTITVVNNRAPTAPGSITVPVSPQGGGETTITWTASTDVDGNLDGYALERQLDGGDWTQVYTGSGLYCVDTIPKGTLTAAYRVRAYDTDGAYSGYTTSATRTVVNNDPPVITSPLSGDLGIKSEGFVVPYIVTDADGDAVTVTEQVGDLVKRSYTAVLGEEQTFHVEDQDGDYFFMQILNGTQVVKITATDANGLSATLELPFTKAVHAASVTLAKPLEVEEAITVAIMSVMANIPDDANYTLEATNNANDNDPVWQDVKADVIAGRNIAFANQVQANGPAFNFRLAVSRGESNTGGYIQSLHGAFQ